MTQKIITIIIVGIAVFFTLKWLYKYIQSSRKTDVPAGCNKTDCEGCIYKEETSCEPELPQKD